MINRTPCGQPGANRKQWVSDTGNLPKNKHSGQWKTCYTPVPSGKGCMQKGPGTRWTVYC